MLFPQVPLPSLHFSYVFLKIESQDYIIDQELLQEIELYGNEFNPSSVVYYLTIAIKSKFDWFYPTWGYATKAMRDFWFDEFKGYHVSRETTLCKKYSDHKPKYIPTAIWNQLVYHWAPDKKFKNWSVTNTTNRASNEGSSMHIGGSISMGEHKRRMKEATGVKPTMEEVFVKCHLKKDKSWIDKRAKRAFEGFKRRKLSFLNYPCPKIRILRGREIDFPSDGNRFSSVCT
ncbi:hypothetical protein QL285_022251 [Trifolium repens]|nr:hypothetical protein QL285_022251 [Trifolium repens]